MTAQPQWSPVDDATADLLTVLADDGSAVPSPADEWDQFVGHLRHVAKFNGGAIDQNDMRVHTRATVSPRRVGPFYRRAQLEGLIVVTGWSISDDSEGRNAGRPMRTFRWIGGDR